MSELVQKCENIVIFKQNFTVKLTIALKWSTLDVSQDFLEFLQKRL